LALFLFGCPGSDEGQTPADTSSDASVDVQVCTPGDTSTCFTCDAPDSTGFQTCNEDGNSWGACECSSLPEDATPSSDESSVEPIEDVVVLPEVFEASLRFHVLKSDTLPELNGVTTAIEEFLVEVNKIWAPTGIVFKLESVLEYEALRQEDFAQLLEEGHQDNPELAQSIFRCEPGNCIFDTDQSLMNGDRPGFNVVSLASMGGLPVGVYSASVGYVFHSQDKPPRLFARSLARALGLNKTGCDDPCNLMRSGQCGPVDEALYLDDCQAQSAQEQLESGSPAPPQTQLQCPCNGLVLPGSDACQGHESSCPAEGGGDPDPGTGPGQGGGGPFKCTTNDDCVGDDACSNDGGLGCACADHPSGTPRCLPLCDEAHECPELPNPNFTYVCQEDICMPMTGAPVE
jgi:hypothetical protein